jgi:hypothetical protein
MKRNSLNNQADPDEKEAVVALVRGSVTHARRDVWRRQW